MLHTFVLSKCDIRTCTQTDDRVGQIARERQRDREMEREGEKERERDNGQRRVEGRDGENRCKAIVDCIFAFAFRQEMDIYCDC